MPQPGFLTVLPRSPLQNPSVDFLQSRFPFQNNPVSFKPVNLFYSQNVPFDTMKIKQKICPPGLRKRVYFFLLTRYLSKNMRLGARFSWWEVGSRPDWGRVADEVDVEGSKIAKKKELKVPPPKPCPWKPTEPQNPAFWHLYNEWEWESTRQILWSTHFIT